jgi:hypothetical protein
MSETRNDVNPVHDPDSQLEQMLIEQFLLARGYDHAGLQALPEEQRKPLLREASIYAAGKLAEIEARAHFVHDLHHQE